MFYAVDTQFSLIFNNSSCYDPYWSILPPLILGHQLDAKASLTGRDYVIAAVVLIWAARLTYNWLRSFKTWSYQGKYLSESIFERLGSGEF
jgi:steroid 5-alpha reductase family enzyme